MIATDQQTAKWKLISVYVQEAFQIIPLNVHFAKHCKQCHGVRFSIAEDHPGWPAAVPQAGIVSLQFNDRSVHPLNFGITYSKDKGRKDENLPLQVELQAHAAATGYYIDNGEMKNHEGEFIPYTLKIYFELTS